jgi:AraC family transcriptional regulator of adaptative response/methylated-DNA-[protein]-cysteine methyltransferase
MIAPQEKQMNDVAPAYHYTVIARALKVIDAEGPGLSLDDLALKMGMSTAHFQRTFTQWVGVSPKRYQQYLTLDHAKNLLAHRNTVLATAHEAGLSGGGRLHDLFLKWEAMRPGDFANHSVGQCAITLWPSDCNDHRYWHLWVSLLRRNRPPSCV